MVICQPPASIYKTVWKKANCSWFASTHVKHAYIVISFSIAWNALFIWRTYCANDVTNIHIVNEAHFSEIWHFLSSVWSTSGDQIFFFFSNFNFTLNWEKNEFPFILSSMRWIQLNCAQINWTNRTNDRFGYCEPDVKTCKQILAVNCNVVCAPRLIFFRNISNFYWNSHSFSIQLFSSFFCYV